MDGRIGSLEMIDDFGRRYRSLVSAGIMMGSTRHPTILCDKQSQQVNKKESERADEKQRNERTFSYTLPPKIQDADSCRLEQGRKE
jgi:hypothetical protein